jgi:capsular polysaccharide biosynthesis protein
MNLVDYGRILWRRGWIIVLLALIAAGSAYVLSQQQTPIYRSTQLVLIQPSRNDLGLTEATTRLLNSYAVYLKSELIAAQVIDILQLDMTPGELNSKVTIAPDPLRFTIQIDVDLPNGDLANDVARTWGEMLVQYRNEQNQTVRREDRIDALLPDLARYELLQPRPTINAIAGAVLGVLLGGIIIFVLEYLESSVVRRRDDLERDLTVLAAIPEGSGKHGAA